MGSPRPETHCKGCDKPWRKKHEKIADFPNTAHHGANGYCTNCKKALRKGKPLPSRVAKEPVELTEKDRMNRANLDAFMASRRMREQRESRRQKVRMVSR